MVAPGKIFPMKILAGIVCFAVTFFVGFQLSSGLVSRLLTGSTRITPDKLLKESCKKINQLESAYDGG
jgi:hypothetical protein